MREIGRSRTNALFASPEHKARMIKMNTGNQYALGHTVSREHRAIVSATQKLRHARKRAAKEGLRSSIFDRGSKILSYHKQVTFLAFNADRRFAPGV
jgi:hypothetical protein